MQRNKKNILVFPCGSEIALEVYRSLKYSTHFNLIGGNSIDDHGKFIFDSYIGDIPFITDDNFVTRIKEVIKDYSIDAIYPATDAAIVAFKKNEDEINCKVVGSNITTVELCLSKQATYGYLKNDIRTPRLFKPGQVKQFPVFGKPDIGYGSRGVKKIDSQIELREFISNNPQGLLCEYFPGEEYTVDCFTNKEGKLLFFMPRLRRRVSNGISVNTVPVYDDGSFRDIVETINKKIKFRGAWFVQLKRDKNNCLSLLEIAARLGGSSSLSRAIGVNLASLTLFDSFDVGVTVCEHDFKVELDRALDTVFKIDINYKEIFCDLDDCLLIDGKYVNTELVALLFQALNENKKLTLLTRHALNIKKTLREIRLSDLFDRIIEVKNDEKKSKYIDNQESIYIDDSYAERLDVSRVGGVPTFGVDMVRGLLR